jgi:hypothetical protein
MAAVSGVIVLVAALVLAGLIHEIEASQQSNERAVLITGVLFAAILAAAPACYLWRTRRHAQPETAGLAFLSTLTVLLVAVYFFWVHWYVFFPADILIWSEGEFVNDMLKFSVGYPIYSAPVNHDSFAYVPGSQLLTYLLAWVAGRAGSIPAYRIIQLCYTALAAFMATLCCRRILRLARPASRAGQGWLWPILWYAACFLMATNSITNGFVHNLHNDALAQLATLTAYYLLLVYVETRSRAVLAAMIVMVPAGFLIKQSLLVWGLLYGAFLAIWGQSWKRLAVFAVSAAALYGAVVATCYAIWGTPFYYWVFYLMGHHSISPLRSFQHVLDTWPYFAAGLFGGIVVLRGRRPDALMGAWLVWLGLITLEAYTSGIAWMLNHLGPGCLMAGTWFLAGLTCRWESASESARPPQAQDWIRAGAVTAIVALMFSGLGLIRIPLRPVSDDAYRYVRDIEHEFEGQPPGKVLLDAGTWIYLKDKVIMGDRAPAIGEEGYANTGDFSLFRSNIRAKRYSKILVRHLHKPDLWYEHALWSKPSGLRDALLESYRETGRIPGAEPPKDVKHRAEDPYLFDEISILGPKTEFIAR